MTSTVLPPFPKYGLFKNKFDGQNLLLFFRDWGVPKIGSPKLAGFNRETLYATPSGQSDLEGEPSSMIGLDFTGLGLIISRANQCGCITVKSNRSISIQFPHSKTGRNWPILCLEPALESLEDLRVPSCHVKRSLAAAEYFYWKSVGPLFRLEGYQQQGSHMGLSENVGLIFPMK